MLRFKVKYKNIKFVNKFSINYNFKLRSLKKINSIEIIMQFRWIYDVNIVTDQRKIAELYKLFQ